MSHEIRTTKIIVVPEGKEIFDPRVIEIEILDEAAGEFVAVYTNADDGKAVRIDPDEWPILREAIDQMVQKCRPATIP